MTVAATSKSALMCSSSVRSVRQRRSSLAYTAISLNNIHRHYQVNVRLQHLDHQAVLFSQQQVRTHQHQATKNWVQGRSLNCQAKLHTE